MTSFIVISTENSLHWILDGIEKCRPSTERDELKHIEPFISTGRIIERKDGSLEYKYTSTDVGKDVEKKTLKVLFQNHVAIFKNQANIGADTINVFVLYNLDDTENDKNEWIFGEISKLVQNNSVNLHTILLSFNQDSPADTTKRADAIRIQEFIERYKKNTKEIDRAKILYLNNLDANGAATWTNESEYRWIMPRMLCDWFMLLSDSFTAADLLNITYSTTGIYSIGYAEYAYLPKEDFERFLDFALTRDMIESIVLNGPHNENDNESPIGLYRQREAKKSRCAKVLLTEDIDDYKGTIDYDINKILCWFEERVNSINAGITKKNDIIQTEYQEKVSHAEEDGGNIDEIEPPKLIEHLKFTTRENLYDYFISLQFDDEKARVLEGCDEKFNELKHCFEDSITMVKDFNSFIDKYQKFAIECSAGALNVNKGEEHDLKNRPGCLLMAWLNRLLKENAEIQEYETVDDDVKCGGDIKEEIRKNSISISKLEDERKRYETLLHKIDDEEKQLNKLKVGIETFRLTSYCKLKNSCNLTRMEEYEKNISNHIIEEVLIQWKSDETDLANMPSRSDLNKILKEKISHHVKKHWWLHWDNLYEFVEPLNLNREEEICSWLQRQSAPYVSYKDNRVPAMDFTSYFYFSNNKDLIERINVKEMNVPNIINAMAKDSHHIANKICMFQILQIDDYLYKSGITDMIHSEKGEGTYTKNKDFSDMSINEMPENLNNKLAKEFWGVI